MIFGHPPAGLQIRNICQNLVSGRARCELEPPFGQRGPQDGALFVHEELTEKIQGKKREAQGKDTRKEEG